MGRVYICSRCGYKCNRKNNYERHLSRKKPCKIKNIKKMLDNSCFTIKKEQNINILKNMSKNTSKIPPFPSKMLNLNKSICSNTTKSKNCPYCYKKFTRTDNLNRHINKRCKMKYSHETTDSDDSDDMLSLTKKEWEKKLEMQKKELTSIFTNQIEILTKNLTTQNYNLTNNSHHSHNNHNSQNIILNNYGSENRDYITDKHLTYLIKRPGIALRKLIEKIHFDPDHPENHNIKATNSRSKLIQVNKDKNWLFRNKKEVINELIESNVSFLENHYTKVQQNLPYSKRKKFEEEMKSIDSSQIEKKNLEITLLNGTKKVFTK